MSIQQRILGIKTLISPVFPLKIIKKCENLTNQFLKKHETQVVK